jgi:CxxC-x17-CxxC domain-containing protein
MKCGNKCKVPFKPINGKGVSCSNCFDKNKAPGRDRKKSGDKRSGSKKTYAQKINDGNKKAFAGRGQKSSRARSSRSKEDKPLSASRGGKSSGRSDGRSFNGRK